MRKVIVTSMEKMPSTSEWKLVVKGEAEFHQWGADYEEFESGPANFTTAVVEWPNGKVEMVRADRVQFVKA